MTAKNIDYQRFLADSGKTWLGLVWGIRPNDPFPDLKNI